MLFVNNLQSLITCKNWSIFWVSTIHPLYVHMCAYKPNCWTMQYHLSFMNLFCFVASFSMQGWFKCQWYLAHGLTALIVYFDIVYHMMLSCDIILHDNNKSNDNNLEAVTFAMERWLKANGLWHRVTYVQVGDY